MKNNNKLYLFVLPCLFGAISSGCAKKSYDSSFEVMGSVCEVKILSADKKKAVSALGKFEALLKKVESDYNYNNPESFVSIINKNASKRYVPLSSDEAWFINKGIEFSILTDGAFDITFYPLWELWKLCEKENRLPSAAELIRIKKQGGVKNILFDYEKRKIKFLSKNLKIHLGGVAKGFALIKCKELASALGIRDMLVNLGGDILAVGGGAKGGWVVGIQDPFEAGSIVKKIKIKNKFVFTSGVYQRFVNIKGKKYHHIINSNTGYPADEFASVSLIYEDADTNYIPSLGVFLMGKAGAFNYLENNHKVDYFIMDKDGKIYSKLEYVEE